MTIGMNIYSSTLWTKNDFKRGKIPTPGSRHEVHVNGECKEFVVVKLASGQYINGSALVLDGLSATVGAAVTASGNPAAIMNARVGVLVFASASLTLSASTTCYAFAQIYGSVLARISGACTLAGGQLGMGAGAAAFISAVAQVSASAALHGVTILQTVSASGAAANGVTLKSVFLTYPRFSGPPDANLA